MAADPRRQPPSPEPAADATGVYHPTGTPAAPERTPPAPPAVGRGDGATEVFSPAGAGGGDGATLDFPAGRAAPAPSPDATPADATRVFVPARDSVPDGTVDLPVGGTCPVSADDAANGDTGAFSLSDDVAAVRDEATAAPPPAPGPGATGRYAPKRFHARGGMGEIWLAEDGDIGRQVALKRMLKGARQEQKDRFVVEARITGQLEHPGIVPVHELGTDDRGQPYYVMKFVHGRTLKKVIQEYHEGDPAATTPREVQRLRLLNIFLDICQTVAYAHSRGVIHRDLKPENVMLGPFGEALVLDWGVAKVQGQPEVAATTADFPPVDLSFSGISTDTLAGSIMGSPFYMAPEMAEGLTDQVDQQSDIYLLGATLYEILTGKPPRCGGSALDLLELARHSPPVPPRQVVRDVPRALEAVCHKAMALRKADRYPSAVALAEDVQRFLAGEPVTAYREGLLERAGRWARRHRRALGRGTAAVVVAGAALFGYVQVREAQHREALSRLREKEAKEQARALSEQEEARQDVQKFRGLADEARFYAASSGPAGDSAPYYDAARGEAAGRAALGVADGWGNDLGRLPLPAERDPLRKEIYDLLLLMAQDKGREASGPEPARQVLALLDRAAALGQDARAAHRLRAAAWQAQGDDARADEERRQSDDPKTALTALDQFLMGEEARTRVAPPPAGQRAVGPPRPDRDGLRQAIEHYRAALKEDPNHYWAHFQLGRCYLALGQEAEAAEALGACVALRPESPWGYSLRGFALARLGRLDDAEWDLDQAVKLSPGLRLARLNHGYVCWQQKKYDAALADYEAVLEPPDDRRLVEAYYYRALVLLQRGEQQKALEDFDRLLAAKPDFRAAYRLRALVRLAQGEDKKGLEDVNAYLAAGRPWDADGAEAHEQVGRLLRALIGELQEVARQWPEGTRRRLLLLALGELDTAVRKGGRSPALFGDRGAVLESLGQLPEAVAAYSRGLEGAPDDLTLRVKRGRAYVARGDMVRARGDFAAVLRHDPAHAESHTWLGYIYALGKKAAEARREANLALLHGSGDYLALHNVACIYAVLSRVEPPRESEYQDLAIDQLRQAIALRKKGGAGPDEIELIEAESAFPKALRDRPEFQELMKGKP